MGVEDGGGADRGGGKAKGARWRTTGGNFGSGAWSRWVCVGVRGVGWSGGAVACAARTSFDWRRRAGWVGGGAARGVGFALRRRTSA